MSRIHIDPDLQKAIVRNQDFKGFDSYARKNYGIPGKVLLARLVAGEAGGKGVGHAGVSSAGARGPAQFIPSTREGYLKQYGLDPWRSNDEAIKAAIIHIKGTGLAGYNPGMPTYTQYILSQRTTGLDDAKGAGRAMFRASVPIPTSKKVTEFDKAGFEQAQKMQLLASFLSKPKGSAVDSLLGGDVKSPLTGGGGGSSLFKTGLLSTQPVSASDFTSQRTVLGQKGLAVGGGGGNARAGNAGGGGGPALAQAIIGRGMKADRLNLAGKLPYKWGGGHGSTPAALGELVDCSGFVSQLLKVTPRTSGVFESWGKPGRGRWATVWASGSHVIIEAVEPGSGKHIYFGTSHTNPGGGAGRITPGQAQQTIQAMGLRPRHPGRR